MAAEKSSFESSVRSSTPDDAVGYRVLIFPNTYPHASRGRDYYAITANMIEYPSGLPAGKHQIEYIDKGGKAIAMRAAVWVRLPGAAGDESDGGDTRKRQRAADVDEDSDDDEDAAEDAPPGKGAVRSGPTFQAKVQELQLQGRRLRIARMARRTQEIGEYHAQFSGLMDDTVSRFQQLDAMARENLAMHAENTRRLVSDIAKVPPPPPPPQDWVGLIKTGIEGIKDVVVTALGARGSAPQSDAAKMAAELAAIRKLLTSGAATVPTAQAGAAAAASSSSSVAPVASTAPAAAPVPAVGAATPPTDAPTGKPAPAASATSAAAASTDSAPTNTGSAPATKEQATARGQHSDDSGSGDSSSNDNGPDDSGSPPAVPEEAAEASHQQTEVNTKAYRDAWKAMRRCISSITDGDIIGMVVNPALMVTYISIVASLAPFHTGAV